MIDVIDAWLRLAADRLHEQAAALTALDQAIGDGDHGTNMDRGFSAIVAHARRRARPRATATVAVRRRTPADRRADADQHGRRRGRARCTAPRSCARAAPSPRCRTATTAGAALVAGTRGRDRRDPVARQGRRPARRRCSMRCCRRSPPDARRPTAAATRQPSTACHGRRRRGGRRRHDPAARHEGPRLLPRRTAHRPPGPGRHLGGPAAAGARRRRRRRRLTAMARTVRRRRAVGPVLVGRVGLPGVGVGRALLVEPPDRRCRTARRCGRRRSDPATERARLPAALETAATELETLAAQTSDPCRRGGRARSSRPRPCSRAIPGIVEPALRPIDAGMPAAEAIMRVDR